MLITNHEKLHRDFGARTTAPYEVHFTGSRRSVKHLSLAWTVQRRNLDALPTAVDESSHVLIRSEVLGMRSPLCTLPTLYTVVACFLTVIPRETPRYQSSATILLVCRDCSVHKTMPYFVPISVLTMNVKPHLKQFFHFLRKSNSIPASPSVRLVLDILQVRLRANDSSLVRVSSEGIFLENTTVLVLRSSSQPRLITLPPTRIPPLSQPARSPGLGGDSVVTMDGGNIVMNASQSFDFDIPGALIKLSRRCGDSTRGSDCVAKAGRESGTSRSSVCVKDDEASLLADADTVEILGRSGAGVTIAAGGPFGGDERLENMGQSDAWQSHNKTLAGGRVKASGDVMCVGRI